MQDSEGVFVWKKIELYVTIIDIDKSRFIEENKLLKG